MLIWVNIYLKTSIKNVMYLKRKTLIDTIFKRQSIDKQIINLKNKIVSFMYIFEQFHLINKIFKIF